MSADRADPCREAREPEDAESGQGAGLGRRLLLEAAVLAALADGPAHGYELRRSLAALTDGFLRVDAGHVYRLLRRLEGDGFVTSAWTEGGFGPQRREYRLTPEGCAHLLSLRPHLEARERAFHSVVEAIGRAAGAGGRGRA